jgi:hypothetical protein
MCTSAAGTAISARDRAAVGDGHPIGDNGCSTITTIAACKAARSSSSARTAGKSACIGQ